MAKAKGSRKGNTSRTGSKPQSKAGGILTEQQVNRLQIIFQQIAGCAELICSHYQEIARDNAMLTAVNIIKEKAKGADEIILSGFRAKHQADELIAALMEKETPR